MTNKKVVKKTLKPGESYDFYTEGEGLLISNLNSQNCKLTLIKSPFYVSLVTPVFYNNSVDKFDNLENRYTFVNEGEKDFQFECYFIEYQYYQFIKDTLLT